MTVRWRGVVKMQLSLYDDPPILLLYSEDRRSVWYMGEALPGSVDLMADRPKAFFEVVLEENGRLHVGDEVEDPGW